MTKYNKYQDYVIRDGNLVGEFEQMYKDFEDPWEQSEKEKFASEKSVCVNLVEAYSRQRVIELGCGFGFLTDRLSRLGVNTIGTDISPTAIKKAKQRYPNCNFVVSRFPDFDLLRSFNPDCIVMAEITWYILDELDAFIEFFKKEMPKVMLIHLLTTYPKGKQKYGSEIFTSLSEIRKYFGMRYLEWGEIETSEMKGCKRTYFAGSYEEISHAR